MIHDKQQKREVYFKVIIPIIIALVLLIYDLFFSKGTHDFIIPVGIILLALIYAYSIFSEIKRKKNNEL
jgi:uncharacterized Tic20 family protein